MYTIIESLNTTIEFNPISIDENEFTQVFEYNNVKYKIEAIVFPSLENWHNILTVGFYNLTSNIEALTSDAGNPSAVFGIVMNWTNIFVKKYPTVQHIVFTSKNNNDLRTYNKRTHLYYKLVDKFLSINSDFYRNEDLDNVNLPEKYKQTQYKIFSISKK